MTKALTFKNPFPYQHQNLSRALKAIATKELTAQIPLEEKERN